MKAQEQGSSVVSVPFFSQFLIEVDAKTPVEANAKSTTTNQHGNVDYDYD